MIACMDRGGGFQNVYNDQLLHPSLCVVVIFAAADDGTRVMRLH